MQPVEVTQNGRYLVSVTAEAVWNVIISVYINGERCTKPQASQYSRVSEPRTLTFQVILDLKKGDRVDVREVQGKPLSLPPHCCIAKMIEDKGSPKYLASTRLRFDISLDGARLSVTNTVEGWTGLSQKSLNLLLDADIENYINDAYDKFLQKRVIQNWSITK